MRAVVDSGHISWPAQVAHLLSLSAVCRQGGLCNRSVFANEPNNGTHNLFLVSSPLCLSQVTSTQPRDIILWLKMSLFFFPLFCSWSFIPGHQEHFNSSPSSSSIHLIPGLWEPINSDATFSSSPAVCRPVQQCPDGFLSRRLIQIRLIKSSVAN